MIAYKFCLYNMQISVSCMIMQTGIFNKSNESWWSYDAMKVKLRMWSNEEDLKCPIKLTDDKIKILFRNMQTKIDTNWSNYELI